MASTLWDLSLDDDDAETVPVCKRLLPTKHKASARNLRLSWPRKGDGKRAIVGKPSSVKKMKGEKTTARINDARMIHVSLRDLEVHYHFASGVSAGCSPPTIDIPLAWNAVKLQVEHESLLQYFQCTASRSLATFGRRSAELGNVLLRKSLLDTSPTATAVLQSLLAFSALHLHGVCQMAVELKLSALRALMTPLERSISITEAIQHVAAGMLILSFEVHQASCTSGEWLLYLRGVKEVIQTTGLDDVSQDADLSILLDWVYYHDVLARFSIFHWHQGSQKKSHASQSEALIPSSSSGQSSESSRSSLSSSVLAVRAKASHAAPPAMNAIELLSDVCDAVSTLSAASMSTQHQRDRNEMEFLRILDWRIRTKRPASWIDAVNDDPCAEMTMELYQLAMLVYLNRVSDCLHLQSSRMQQYMDRAFVIIPLLPSCKSQFSIFIFGCESRNDSQRAMILDLVTRTEESVASRSFNYVRRILQAIWAQEDLTDGDINYLDKLSNIISCCRILPTFV